MTDRTPAPPGAKARVKRPFRFTRAAATRHSDGVLRLDPESTGGGETAVCLPSAAARRQAARRCDGAGSHTEAGKGARETAVSFHSRRSNEWSGLEPVAGAEWPLPATNHAVQRGSTVRRDAGALQVGVRDSPGSFGGDPANRASRRIERRRGVWKACAAGRACGYLYVDNIHTHTCMYIHSNIVVTSIQFHSTLSAHVRVRYL